MFGKPPFRLISAVNVPLFTVSDQKAKSFLERMAALGFTGTDLIQLDDASPTENLSSERTAGLLYSYIKNRPLLILFCVVCRAVMAHREKSPFYWQNISEYAVSQM